MFWLHWYLNPAELAPLLVAPPGIEVREETLETFFALIHPTPPATVGEGP